MKQADLKVGDQVQVTHRTDIPQVKGVVVGFYDKIGVVVRTDGHDFKTFDWKLSKISQ